MIGGIFTSKRSLPLDYDATVELKLIKRK